MRNVMFSVAATLLVAAAQAQSCNGTAPAGRLQTSYAGGVYAGATSATVGANMFFDLAVNADMTISQIGINLYDAGYVTTLPNLSGATGPIQFWVCPISWSGNQNIQANWTLVGTGTVTVGNAGSGSPIVFNPPLSLTAGNYGVALTLLPVTTPGASLAVGPIHPLYTNPTSNPIPTVYRDQYLTLTAGVVQQTAWTGGVGGVRVINMDMNYQPGAAAGYTITYGTGCYIRPQSFYEYQAGGTTTTAWDLANNAMTAINTGANYTVIPGSGVYTPSTSPNLTTVGSTYDDDITAAQTLPFSFPYPGGSTTSIIISTNGHVFLGTSTATFGPYTFSAFFTDVPRIAAAWSDWDMTTQGGMHYDVDPSNQFVTVTWDNVQEWVSTGNVGNYSFQLKLWSTGQIDWIWGNVGHSSAPFAVGFGRGNNTGDPGSIDLSASIPFSSGDGSVPPVLSMNPRPVIGTTANFITTNITPGTLFGLLAFSFIAPPPSPFNDLSLFGMPGCFQNVGLPATTAFLFVNNGSLTLPLAIPNDPSYNGVNLFAQSAPLTAGLNSAGILTSNGMCVHIGLQ
jgi:hypothetical protein